MIGIPHLNGCLAALQCSPPCCPAIQGTAKPSISRSEMALLLDNRRAAAQMLPHARSGLAEPLHACAPMQRRRKTTPTTPSSFHQHGEHVVEPTKQENDHRKAAREQLAASATPAATHLRSTMTDQNICTRCQEWASCANKIKLQHSPTDPVWIAKWILHSTKSGDGQHNSNLFKSIPRAEGTLSPSTARRISLLARCQSDRVERAYSCTCIARNV